MDDSLYPKIGDFGLWIEIQNDSKIIEFAGTLLYMSPEHMKYAINHKPNDIYAFALMVYEIITLEIPFKGVNVFKMMAIAPNGYRPEIKSDVPDCWRKLIEKCWSQDPSQRPTFSEIVDLLKIDQDFITSTVDQDEFLNYIEYLEDNYPILTTIQKDDDTFELSQNQDEKSKSHVINETKIKESASNDNFNCMNIKTSETDFNDS